MGVLGSIRKKIDWMTNELYCIGQIHGEKAKIADKRRQELIRNVKLTAVQEKEILRFYEQNYGKRISLDWHKLYQSFTGIYCKDYFPEILLSSKFEPLVNRKEYRYVLDDKLLLPVFCTDIDNVKIPDAVVTYCNGIYFDSNKTILSKQETMDKLYDIDKVIIKLVQDTSSGRGVRLLALHSGVDENSNEKLHKIIDEYSKNAFVIQRLIKPHRLLKKLYENSVNTFRIVTYVWNGKVYHWPIALRIGQGGNYLDNAHAGGMFIGVSDDGFLRNTAYTEFQKVYYEHPDSHVVFKGYELPFVPNLIKTAEKMHLNAPVLGLISWDFTVDEDGVYVLVETNTTGQSIWFPQMANGKPAFGDRTADVLKFISSM